MTNQVLNENDAAVTTSYIDGLGRSIQSVARRGSPSGRDIIAPADYDNLGRQPRAYLPFVSSQTTGGQVANALQDQYNFYQPTATNQVADAKNPYASILQEDSPLGRVLEQAGPGESWYPGADWANPISDRKTVRFNQRSNRKDVDGEIIIWQANGNLLEDSGSEYGDNILSVSEIQDEHEARTLEFTDKSGQAVLKRVQGDKNNWLDTYYVYDDFGNLIYVIPPEARKKIADGGFTAIGPVPEDFTRLDANRTYNTVQSAAQIYYNPGVKVTLGSGFSFTSSGTDQFRVVGGTLAESLHYGLLFAYEYDFRQRMIAKKVPGAKWEYLVYDKWDRLVLTQNGNQRDSEEWSFIKYDADNRPVISGLVTLTGKDIATVRTDAESATGRYVIKDALQTTTWGYNIDNNTYPTIASTDLLSVTYYDDYTCIDGSGWTALGFYDDNRPSETFYLTTHHTALKGLVTGGATKILDASGAWLRSKTYYDTKYRVIQAQGENILGGSDRITSVYDFAGNLTRSFQTHDPLGTTNTPDIEVRRILDYDHANRLLSIDHQVDDQPIVRLATNRYNEIGELIEKNLHSENGGPGRQSLDYTYNIRGWLTAINDPDLTSEPGDLFGMKLNYDQGQSGLAFNGNISGMQWQTSVGGKKRTYGYLYDELNRIKMADFKAGAGWNEENAHHEMRIGSYDYNGNILDLERKDLPNAAGMMDDMTYSYRGNQLLAVSDAGSNTLGFKDGVTGTTEYHYDYNGNMTADQNKGISSITYNHLNLPETVDMGGGNTITYTYDAAGAKLKQEIKEGGTLKTTRSYVGGFIYEQEGTGDKELSLIQTEEGRLVPWRVNENIAGYEYQYHLTDHLGNVRLTFAGNNEAEVTATMETETSSFEEDIFRNMGTRQLVVTGLNHTPVDPLITVPDHAAYLEMAGGATTEIVGPATSFAVNMADTVDIEVFGKFEDQASFSTTVLGGIAGELANAFVNLTGLENLSEATDAFSNAFTAIGQYGGNDSSTPRAFLNYILFDEDHDYVTSGFDRMDDGAGVTPPNESAVAFDKMAFSIPVTKKGYIYIYVSNETPGAKVWFDDLTVTHIENEVVQADDYYPFGLTMASTSYQGEDRLENRFLFNAGSEYEKAPNWYDTPFRKYDAGLGRFNGIDLLANVVPGVSPYQFGFNSPVSFNDPLGLIPGCPECLPELVITATPLPTISQTLNVGGAILGEQLGAVTIENQVTVSYSIGGFINGGQPQGKPEIHIDGLQSKQGIFVNSGELTINTPDFIDRWASSNGFVASITYPAADGLFLTAQFFKFWDLSRTHLNGQAAVGDDLTDGFVSTASLFLPIKGVRVARGARGLWKLTDEGSSVIKRHSQFGKIFKSRSDDLWWAVDNAGHGGSKFKVFKEGKKGLEWFRDADEFGNFILNKHKGSTGKFIPWGQLKTIK